LKTVPQSSSVSLEIDAILHVDWKTGMIDQVERKDTHIHDDEIDLRELFVTLWRGKWVITFCVLVAIALASLYLRSVDKKYTVTYIFKPVSSEDKTPSFSGLGGLASLAGVSLPSSSSGDFTAFKLLLKSEEVATLLMDDTQFIREIFALEWNDAEQTFERPPPGTLTPLKAMIKSVLLGEGEIVYIAPNPARLADWIRENLSVSDDLDTGMLTLTSETIAPELMLDVIDRVSSATDRLLKERFVATSEKTMSFYQQKLAAARAREHREALAKLIAQEDQKLMLASKGSYFVAEPLTTPSISLYPTSPKSSLVLALAIVLGGFFGAALMLIRKAIKS